MTQQTVDIALKYAARGWHVFPVKHKDKAPLTRTGFKEATVSEDQIRKWWQQWPDANIGIATGTISGILVVDIDPRNRGDEEIELLAIENGWWVDTKTVKTGGNGTHYYFKCETAFACVNGLWDGVDIKADGGYVVAPPSITENKYVWIEPEENYELQPVPEWIIEELQKRRRSVKPPAGVEEDGVFTLAEGQRDNGLTKFAGTLRRHSCDFEEMLNSLLGYNLRHCKPPLPEKDVARIARSISEKPAGNLPVANRPLTYEEIPDENIYALMQDTPQEPDYILDGWVVRGDAAMLVGDLGAGKSFLGLDIALAGAVGDLIWDYFPVSKPFKTYIVDEENTPDEVHRRLYNIAKARGIKPAELEDRFRMATPRHGFSFRRPDCIQALYRKVQSFQPDLIIFDSFTATSNVDDENKREQVRRFFHDQLYPLQAICGSTILYIHHTNKAVYGKERMTTTGGLVAGSIDFLGAADTCMVLDSQAHPGYTTLTNVKPRRMKMPAQLKLRIMDTANGGIQPVVFGEIEKHKQGTEEAGGVTAGEAIMTILRDDRWHDDLYPEVADLVPCKRANFDQAAKRLRDRGLIEFKPNPLNTNLKIWRKL